MLDLYGDDLVAFRKHVKKYKQRGLQVRGNCEPDVFLLSGLALTRFVCISIEFCSFRWNTRSGEEMKKMPCSFPVLKICFGPPTAESKNLKNHVNFDVGDLFFRSPALWSSQNVFGPPTVGRVVVDFKDRV